MLGISTFDRSSNHPLVAAKVFLLACTKGRNIHRRRFLLLRPPPPGHRPRSRGESPKDCRRRCTLPVPQRPTLLCSCRQVRRFGRRKIASSALLESGHICSRCDEQLGCSLSNDVRQPADDLSATKDLLTALPVRLSRRRALLYY